MSEKYKNNPPEQFDENEVDAINEDYFDIPSTKELIESGDLIPLTDFSTLEDEGDVVETEDGVFTEGEVEYQKLLDKLRAKYGENSIVADDVYNPETKSARRVDGAMGLYVTAEAYKAVHGKDTTHE